MATTGAIAGAKGRSSALGLALMGTTFLAPAAALAQQAAPATAPAAEVPAAPAPAPAAPEVIQRVEVTGNQRLEPDTVLSYIRLRAGQVYSQASADQALKDLFATELFTDVQIRQAGGVVTIQVKENPVINRIIFEGNKRLKEDKITPEIKLAARQIFTRSKVRADVARIIELYKRQGRFAATVEPKMVMLDQNRVDIVFEINEGPKSKVRQINIIGNDVFDDGELRSQMVTKQSRAFRLFSSRTSYDPDRLAYDQQKLRQFYLTQGYADFRVVSAVAELTPDKHDFIITYVVEEGKRYKFGDVKVESQLRDFDGEVLAKQLPMKKGDWYNAKTVEDTIDKLNQTAGAFGYAFADVRPDYGRNKDDLTMGITFQIAEAPRVYVERIDVNGNTLTQDKVIRREFRLAEGDAFNSLQVKRSTNRIKSLGYFQEKFEVEQKPGSAPDRIVLEANLEEKPTGELQLSAGFSSIESFILQASIQQRNFRGRGQTVGTSVSYSRYSKSVELNFVEPYVFDRNVSFGANIYRRDYNSFNYLNSERNNLYQQATTGFQLRLGLPVTEYASLIGRYTLNFDNVSLDQATYYATNPVTGAYECSSALAGRYLCDAIGKRTSSILGLSLVYDTLDNRVRPTRGNTASVSADFAGLGGSVKYARLRANGAKYWPLGGGFIFSLNGEGGIIKALKKRYDSAGNEIEGVYLTDRFYLGSPEMRGFDIRGIGPRIVRKYVDSTSATGFGENRDNWQDDAIGGRYYYQGRAEVEIPLGSGAREMGIRPSIFADIGAVWGVQAPSLSDVYSCTTGETYRTTAVKAGNPDAVNCTLQSREFYYGDSYKPRVAVGVGFNWNSPFGPFRLDFAKTLLSQPGDDPKTFNFNVGTQF
ncbi:outer membrane protein assembly factor BamA [Novosphingobium flavum]|uniref:Outer membrane protein assembly factor BamA n=1 Tax=Novosphingobium flavum TaxID=1778672 RepID=A0A7X1FQ14_9SPHN|nr:outer membrane protein assembly factor BamA [Novosphingobium flavum]MBC2664866.1 outer membrane protein assembly factor BamA [Novosphingobium flavum]